MMVLGLSSDQASDAAVEIQAGFEGAAREPHQPDFALGLEKSR